MAEHLEASFQRMLFPWERGVFGPKKEGFDAKGSVGTVLRTYSEKNLSPNRGIKVEFQEPKKWVAHFERWELELVE